MNDPAFHEALALGPMVADGRRISLFTSDDDASSTQLACILVLAIPLRAP